MQQEGNSVFTESPRNTDGIIFFNIKITDFIGRSNNFSLRMHLEYVFSLTK